MLLFLKFVSLMANSVDPLYIYPCPRRLLGLVTTGSRSYILVIVRQRMFMTQNSIVPDNVDFRAMEIETVIGKVDNVCESQHAC